jgi:capsular polysaccharide biosynthesis protein
MIEARRRGWVILLAVLLVVLVGWAVSRSKDPSYEAEAVLVAHAAVPIAEQPNSSSQLAATYTPLISLDRKIETSVENQLPEVEAKSYTVANDPNTAVLRVNFSARTSDGAIEGARVLSLLISGGNPVSGNIKPNTISIVSLPTDAEKSTASSQLLVVSIFLGLLLGFVLVGFWRPRDVRLDTLRDLRQHLPCPCFAIDLETRSGLHPLFDVLADMDGRTLAVVPCTSKDKGSVQALVKALKNAFGADRAIATGVPGSDEAGELAAADADAAIVVVRTGERAMDLSRAADLLHRYGTDPAYGVIAQGRGKPTQPTPRAPEPGAAKPTS